MAEPEPEIATKAPENDATPQSVIPNDTPAQEGASMGEHCVMDRPPPAGAQSTGEISKIEDVDCYITKPSDYPHSPSKLLLFLTSGTGLHSINNQLQADQYAAEGFLVVMPDMFGGDPAPNSRHISAEEAGNQTVIDQVKVMVADTIQTTAKAFQIDMWLARHTPEKVMPILRKVIAGMREQYADAVANGDGLYSVGYCFGGLYVLLLGAAPAQASQDEEKGPQDNEPLIKAGALAHATQVSPQDLESVRSPICLVCVENDQLFPDEIRDAGKKKFEEKALKHDLKVYPGVPHGFAVVGEYDDEKIEAAQKEAFHQMLTWLKEN